MKPKVRVNEEPVGVSKAKGFFFVDRPPGDYRIACSTEVERAQTLRLEAMEVRYIRTRVAMGFFVGRVVPELVSEDKALKEIQKLRFTGDPAVLLDEVGVPEP